MPDVNDVLLNKIITDDSYDLLNSNEWESIEYNDVIIIEKTNGMMGKYYYKSVNDIYLICGNLKFKSTNTQYKYIPFRFLKTNILKLYRQSKVHYNLDFIKLNNKICSLERDNKILKKKINDIIKTINNFT
jgi:hypothetical protein